MNLYPDHILQTMSEIRKELDTADSDPVQAQKNLQRLRKDFSSQMSKVCDDWEIDLETPYSEARALDDLISKTLLKLADMAMIEVRRTAKEARELFDEKNVNSIRTIERREFSTLDEWIEIIKQKLTSLTFIVCKKGKHDGLTAAGQLLSIFTSCTPVEVQQLPVHKKTVDWMKSREFEVYTNFYHTAKILAEHHNADEWIDFIVSVALHYNTSLYADSILINTKRDTDYGKERTVK